MKLRVQYTAQLRAAVGRKEEEVELPAGSSMSSLLNHLATKHGGAAQLHLFTSGGLTQPSLLVVVNGSAMLAREADIRVLQPGDVITLMPPIAGG